MHSTLQLPLSDRCMETAQKIFSTLPKCPNRGRSMDEIGETLNLSKSTVNNYLETMREQKLVTRKKISGGIFLYCKITTVKKLKTALKKSG